MMTQVRPKGSFVRLTAINQGDEHVQRSRWPRSSVQFETKPLTYVVQSYVFVLEELTCY